MTQSLLGVSSSIIKLRFLHKKPCVGANNKNDNPVGKYLFKVSKTTFEQRSSERRSNVVLQTLNMYLPTGNIRIVVFISFK